MIKEKISKSRFIVIGSLLLLIGLSIFASYNIYNYYSHKVDNNKANDFIEEIKKEEPPVEIEQEEQPKEETPKEENYNYIGVVEIPTIDFKRGFFNIDDRNNIVDKNIEVLINSDMPDVTNGILAIAGHSGSGRTAYFKNLYKLKVNDEINVYYNNTKYIYKVNKNYEVDKNGIIDVSRDKEQTTLVLTTCSKNKTKQVVVLAYLVDKVNY